MYAHMVLKIPHKSLKVLVLVYCFLYNRKRIPRILILFYRSADNEKRHLKKITLFYKWRNFRNFQNDNVYCAAAVFAVVVIVVTEKVTTQTLTSWGFNGICLRSKVAKYMCSLWQIAKCFYVRFLSLLMAIA